MTFIIGTPHARGAGYYRNDDRLSGGTLSEADVLTCPHCQAVVKLQEWKVRGGFCRRCDAPVCFACYVRVKTYGCEPFLKLFERQVDAVVKYEQYLKRAGLERLPETTPQLLISP